MTVLPERLKISKCISLKNMPVGGFIFEVPWVMFSDAQGKLWIDGSRDIMEWYKKPFGTSEMKLTRTKNGFFVDTTCVEFPHRRWSMVEKPNSNSVPVVSIR